MKRFRFIENELCCDVYYNKEKNNKKTVIFFYGFPATIGSNILTEFLTNNGYTVLHPHYYGSYDSALDFSPTNCCLTVKTILSIVAKGKVINLKTNQYYNLPQEIEMCVGYSFGAYVLRKSINYLENIQSILLISPVPVSDMKNSNCWVDEPGDEHLQYVMNTRPYTYRIKNLSDWEEKYINDHNELKKHNNKIKNVLWIYGEEDSSIINSQIVRKYVISSKEYFSESANTKLLAIQEGSHSIDTLINSESEKLISSFLFS